MGNPGGRGNAGGQHHHRINFDKYHPGYFGKVGMRHYHKKHKKSERHVVNLDRIWKMVSENIKKNPFLGDSKKLVIDVGKFHYNKVLGKGYLPPKPFVVKTQSISKLASKKIKNS